MTPEEFPKEPMAQIEAILEYETGLPAEFFNTHSIEDVEERLGIPHYAVLEPYEWKDSRGHIRYDWRPITAPYTEEKLLGFRIS